MDDVEAKIPTFLSIVMPVYNEQGVISTVVSDYLKVLIRFQRGEIVLVNDCSQDATPAILTALSQQDARVRVLNNEINLGHGQSLLKAYRAAQGDYVFHVDSDNQFVAEDFWLLWSKLQSDHLDGVIGRRDNRQDSFVRAIVTFGLKVTLATLFRHWIRDPNSPFRLYARSTLTRLLDLIPPDTNFTSIGLTVAALNQNYDVGLVNVRHVARGSDHSFLRSLKIFKLAFASAGEILALRRSLKGRGRRALVQ